MRDLGSNDNKVVLKDAVSGSEIEFSYRTPTTAELQEYYSNLIFRRAGKTISNAVAARVSFALKIITGIRDGDFGMNGKLISSNPQSSAYCEGWKNILKEKAVDLLDAFVLVVFDKMRIVEDMETEKELPLEQSLVE